MRWETVSKRRLYPILGLVLALGAPGGLLILRGIAHGQLGRGAFPDRSVTPMPVMMLVDATDLDAGWHFTCAVRVGGTVWCWGDNTSGQIGDDSTTDRAVPTLVMMSAIAIDVDAGEMHACQRTAAGALSCWGLNGNGQLGDNTTTDHHTGGTPVMVVTDAVWVSTGADHTCAARRASLPMCWGLGDTGQLGNGMNADQRVPVSVMGLP